MLRRGKALHYLPVLGFTLALSIFAVFCVESASPEAKSIAAFWDMSLDSGQTQIVLSQDGSQVQGKGAESFGNRIQITQGGTYVITGSLTEGQIYVAAGEDETVTLMLAGASVTKSSEAAIHIECAGKTEIILAEGTENVLQSGEESAMEETEQPEEAAALSGKKGAVYANCDLLLWGEGTLNILGYLNDGIHTKGSLTINSGNFHIESRGDGVQAKAALEITGGSFSVIAGGGSENAVEKTENFKMSSEFQGREPEREGESFDQGSRREIPEGVSPENQGENRPQLPEGMGPGEQGENGPRIPEEMGPGAQGENGSRMPERMRPDSPEKNGLEVPKGMQPDVQEDEEDETEISTKGFKCKTQMLISGGSFSVDTQDDAFHSDESIRITGGSFQILSGDDGVHADNELTITNGTLEVEKCYEGLEAGQILIQGGCLSITSSDDGVNASVGSSGFGIDEAENAAEEMPNFRMTGGSLAVNAGGDGLDSNGNIFVEGGEICVDGPSDNGNGAIDSGSENGGVCQISGGTILAVGSSGMAETFDEESAQNSFCHNFSQSFEAGEEIRIEDSEGVLLYSHTAAKAGNSVVFSSPKLEAGETYTLYAGDQSIEIHQESVSTNSGDSRSFRSGRF